MVTWATKAQLDSITGLSPLTSHALEGPGPAAYVGPPSLNR
jgi:hypothetical protein